MPSKAFEGIGFFHRELWVLTCEHQKIVPKAKALGSFAVFSKAKAYENIKFKNLMVLNKE